MINLKRTGSFISYLRKNKNMTQSNLALSLGVTYQAVSKWENGIALPDIELLLKLSQLFKVSIEEILEGNEKSKDSLTYAKAGVDINLTDAIKKQMALILNTDNTRVLNDLEAFASIFDINFPKMKNPTLVLKSEAPGSKQMLAFKYGYIESICDDMINHLVNDIIVMGAKPLAVLDTIICSDPDKEIIIDIVKGINAACKYNDCVLVGGETSIQPGITQKGTYILSSNVIGIVEKENIIDGSKISSGDKILAVESNGLHTNGYSLIRMLIDKYPDILNEKIEGTTFLDCIMKPHKSYYNEFKDINNLKGINGMAHITGGGILNNFKRIIPKNLKASISLNRIKILPIFTFIKNKGNVPDEDMIKTFNLGVGMLIVADKYEKDSIIKHLSTYNCSCYEIGEFISGESSVEFSGSINWG